MRRQLLLILVLFLMAAIPVAGMQILLVARDTEDHPLSGFRFAYGGVESQATNQAGATELDLPPDHRTGQQIKIHLVFGAKRSEDWFLVNPQVNIPSGSTSAEVVLMRRSTLRQIAAEARDASRSTAPGPGELTAEDRKRVLVEAAARYGLNAEQLETALRSFAETQDPKDRGIAAYLEDQYSKAEKLLEGAAEKKESDLVETLGYLGDAQCAQAKYQDAAASFRKALALREEDSTLMSLLGNSLLLLTDLAGAEPLLRRALDIDEKSLGAEHPNVARDLNSLATLRKDQNRPAEAEPLLRRALAISEKSGGIEHPHVAICLNNLAVVLVETNRYAEAEPLMRRALAIDEKNFGAEHPEVARDLNSLADMLKSSNRIAEAEPLMRRALTIDEKNFGNEHPKIALDLNHLAQLLKSSCRIDESEPLMRRALAIDEKNFDPEHPTLATELNNLALLLQDTNRFTEAEPLMRRALMIFLEFERRNGFKHTNQEITSRNYRGLLQAMCKSQAEIEATIKALAPSPESNNHSPGGTP
jgi:tetratricopeptide (TPR) repeat protein